MGVLRLVCSREMVKLSVRDVVKHPAAWWYAESESPPQYCSSQNLSGSGAAFILSFAAESALEHGAGTVWQCDDVE
jgi:hypothetical protein